ncbi:MAG: hypothetical protein L6413_06770 [Coriobacteriia bacterium]|nr:hypothetical protein [Coriobacteriia bacterium]
MSDQDFFFDEEEQAEDKSAKTAERVERAATEKAPAVPAAGMQSVSMTVASLIGVVALLVGIIIGIIIPAGASTGVPAPTSTGTGAAAPQLSPEELQSGELPSGHPDIGAVPAAKLRDQQPRLRRRHTSYTCAGPVGVVARACTISNPLGGVSCGNQ